MKVKIYVVDFETSARARKWGIRLGILTLLLGTAAVALAASASALHVWGPGDTLQATDLNGNFSNLQAQISANAASVQNLQTAMVPPGTIVAFGGDTPPLGWLNCDGTSVEIADRPALSAAIGTTWGSSSSTSFNLPDLRGMFLRGVNGTRANISGLSSTAPDPDATTRIPSGQGNANAVGSIQGSAFASHTHAASSSIPAYNNAAGSNWGLNGVYNQVAQPLGPVGLSVTVSAAGSSSETRPVNVAVTYIIKY